MRVLVVAGKEFGTNWILTKSLSFIGLIVSCDDFCVYSKWSSVTVPELQPFPIHIILFL